MVRLRFSALLLSFLVMLGCASTTNWVRQDQVKQSDDVSIRLVGDKPSAAGSSTLNAQRQTRSEPTTSTNENARDAERPLLSLHGKRDDISRVLDGQLLGRFRNTYYDFPAESDFKGAATLLMNKDCKSIKEVPRGFYDAVCVQGSGTLATGATVSFAKRDCACAEVCPRTDQRICFDRLKPELFPFGRGAQGTPITPLRTIAVDSTEIPLGTWVYIPKFDGVARRPNGPPHDGCFKAEDRGLKVKGQHVDIFTGRSQITAHLNQQVPSNQKLKVYIGTARCAGLE